MVQRFNSDVEAMGVDLPGPLMGDENRGWVTNPHYHPDVTAFLDRVKDVTEGAGTVKLSECGF